MKDSLSDTIFIPYKWTTGKSASIFLGTLKDEGKLLASRCGRGAKRYIPPISYCPVCFIEIDEFVDAGITGELIEFTVVHKFVDGKEEGAGWVLI